MSALELPEEQALTPSDLARLARLEIIIEDGLATFVKVGDALLEIRSKRLYRVGFDTFEDYCQERWAISKTHANRLVQSAAVIQVLTPIGVTPSTESQARELAPLLDHPEQLREAWQEVVNRYPEPTAAKVREVVQSRMDVHYSSATDLWSTPQDLYDELHAEFQFELDVCATNDNAKCATFYTAAEDGLRQPWRGVCWMNPPYGDEIKAWVQKAHQASQEGATVVCLVPARVDTGWWWNHCRYGEIRFLRGRLKFGGGDNSAPFPSAVVVFGRPEAVIWWDR